MNASSSPRVVKGMRPGAVYIGRPSKWGNPFVIGRHGDRDQVIATYEEWLRTMPTLMQSVRDELRGRDLACYCAPLRCHGDVLLKIANENGNERFF